jgi:hypothetical protein
LAAGLPSLEHRIQGVYFGRYNYHFRGPKKKESHFHYRVQGALPRKVQHKQKGSDVSSLWLILHLLYCRSAVCPQKILDLTSERGVQSGLEGVVHLRQRQGFTNQDQVCCETALDMQKGRQEGYRAKESGSRPCG